MTIKSKSTIKITGNEGLKRNSSYQVGHDNFSFSFTFYHIKKLFKNLKMFYLSLSILVWHQNYQCTAWYSVRYSSSLIILLEGACGFWQVIGRAKITIGEESLSDYWFLLALSPFHLVLLGAQSMAGAESRPQQSPGLFRIGRRRSPAKDDRHRSAGRNQQFKLRQVFWQISFPRSRSPRKCSASRIKFLDFGQDVVAFFFYSWFWWPKSGFWEILLKLIAMISYVFLPSSLITRINCSLFQ